MSNHIHTRITYGLVRQEVCLALSLHLGLVRLLRLGLCWSALIVQKRDKTVDDGVAEPLHAHHGGRVLGQKCLCMSESTTTNTHQIALLYGSVIFCGVASLQIGRYAFPPSMAALKWRGAGHMRGAAVRRARRFNIAMICVRHCRIY